MKRISILFAVSLFCLGNIKAQETDSTGYQNSADLMLGNDSKLNIGGYGEIHFNNPFSTGVKNLGTLDVHRLVMFLGYNFSSKTQFISEIEFEYAKELWVEQAFIQQRINPYINFRAGLLLVPMGIINEYHEPTTFNGVERPVIDTRLSLSTWREIGIGFSGSIMPITMKYQLYLMGGLNGHDSRGIFNGASGLRDGRQKGSKAYVSSPAITGKVEFYGISSLNVGLSAYLGKSQSKLYGQVPKGNSLLMAAPDSSVVGISMFGADARFLQGGFEARGQLYYVSLSNTDQYNIFTGTGTVNNDLGKTMLGYYAEAGYNLFKLFDNIEQELVPFIRYEFYNTHQSVGAATTENLNYKNTLITTGITFRLNKKAVIKTDIQFAKAASEDDSRKTFNAGIGVMF